jgi:nitroreductase
MADEEDSLGPRNYLSAEHLANHIQDAPVWIIPVLHDVAMSKNPRAGSSIYGAIQNLMLAARAYGIGSTLTTLHTAHESHVKKLLKIPDDALTMALIPLGYPNRGKWFQPKRKAVKDVTYWEFWDIQKSQAKK